jgi:hypothetical protein
MEIRALGEKVERKVFSILHIWPILVLGNGMGIKMKPEGAYKG